MQADGTETLYVEIPPALKYLVDEDDRTNKDVVIAALERELGVSSADSVAIVKRKIRRKEQRLQEHQEEAREAQDRVTRLKDDLDELRSLKDSKEDDAGTYEDRLDEILDDLEDADAPLQHIDPYHSRLDELRVEYDRSTDEIHFDLKARAASEGRELLNTHFMQKMRADQTRRHGDEQPIEEAVDGEGGDGS